MTLLGVRGSSVISATATLGTVTNTANLVDGLYGVNNATLCVWNTTATPSGVCTIDIGSFAVGAIPVGSTLTSVTASVRHQNNNSARFASITIQGFDGATAIGTPVAGTIVNTAHNDSAVIPATLTQLKSGGFKVRVVTSRNAVASSASWSMDYLDLTTVYTAPAIGGRPKVWTGSAWTAYPAKVWTGSSWVEYPVKHWTGSSWELV